MTAVSACGRLRRPVECTAAEHSQVLLEKAQERRGEREPQRNRRAGKACEEPKGVFHCFHWTGGKPFSTAPWPLLLSPCPRPFSSAEALHLLLLKDDEAVVPLLLRHSSPLLLSGALHFPHSLPSPFRLPQRCIDTESTVGSSAAAAVVIRSTSMSRLSSLPPRPSTATVSSSSSSISSAAPPPAPFSLSAEALGDVGDLDVGRETTWLQPFQRSWEDIEEDASGLLLSSTLQLQKQRKAAIPIDPPLIISKGVIRALVVVVDFSSSMALTDLKPSRRLLTLSLLSNFITEYFDQNPLSQLSFVLGHRGVAVKVTELSGHPQEQMRRLREKCEAILMEEEKAQRGGGGGGGAGVGSAAGGGSFSLQNCCEMAKSTLSGVPSYASRELLCLISSLSTVDASDIQTSINSLKSHRCVASVIHLAAELHICVHLAVSTGGRHSVVLNKEHYSTLLRSFLPPMPSVASNAAASALNRRWMRMGFPRQRTTPYPHPLLLSFPADLHHIQMPSLHLPLLRVAHSVQCLWTAVGVLTAVSEDLPPPLPITDVRSEGQ